MLLPSSPTQTQSPPMQTGPIAKAPRSGSFSWMFRALLSIAMLGYAGGSCVGQEAQETFKPDQSNIPVRAPEGAIVLLDENHLEFLSMKGEATDWSRDAECLVAAKSPSHVNHIVSKWHFRDADIHVEFMVSDVAEGNSGIYIHGNYEMQIFNSFGKEEINEHVEGALYGFAKPLVNASRKAGEWQVYDIRYL